MLDSKAATLPQPSDEAKKRSSLLMQSVQHACASSGGWIRFSAFMNIALYEPGLGYYSGGLQKFGQRGDFITSPEISPLFGQCLANQVSEILTNFKDANGEYGSIVEFGAGSGVLAVDILLALEMLGTLPEEYLILELSAELQERQRETIENKIPHMIERVRWLDKLPDDISTAVVIANEVLDAMPVECFRIVQLDDENAGDKIESLVVSFDDGKLASHYEPADDPLVEKIKIIQQRSEFGLSDGYCSEYNPAIAGWLTALSNRVENLVILLIDYGYNEQEYYHPDRTNGTLMCYYQHRAHEDYFWWPGLQDITAFVNFTDVAYCAVDSGMDVSGYTTQAAFLLASGLSELHASQLTDEVQQQVKLSQQIKTLTLPSEMGERFKVMALTKNYDEPLKGFSLLDLRNRL